jgi:dTDP-4-amino-4,6-dideoxygalactose transaminase
MLQLQWVWLKWSNCQPLLKEKEIISFYKSELEGIGDIAFQQVSDDVNPNWWMPTIATVKQRAILKLLNENKLQSRPFWVPMNQLPMFSNNIYFNVNDSADFIYKHCLSIPCSTNITNEEMIRVVEKIKLSFI